MQCNQYLLSYAYKFYKTQDNDYESNKIKITLGFGHCMWEKKSLLIILIFKFFIDILLHIYHGFWSWSNDGLFTQGSRWNNIGAL